MRRKQFAALVLVCSLCVGILGACGKTETAGANGEDNGPMLLFLSQQDEWLMELQDACAVVAEENGYTLEVIDAEADADRQIEQIAEQSDQGEGAFLVNLVDPSRADEAIEAAGNRDIVFINRAPTDLSILDETHIYVGSNESEAGELQGQVLAEYCQSEGISDISYILLKGPDVLGSSEQRADAVIQTIADAGHQMTPVCEPLVCDYDRKQAREAMLELLTNGLSMDSVDCIISTDDAMALGAIEAIRESKQKTMPIIVGVDGSSEALEAVKDGTILMTAYQDEYRQAETAVLAANNLNHGRKYSDDITVADRVDKYVFWISFQSVTADNVSEIME